MPVRDVLPIFGIFGHHESGKTTLIEQLLPRLFAKGISVVVAKVHGSHLEVDTPGKDSHRLFEAGADVFMQGKTQGFLRKHTDGTAALASGLANLARRYDLVLVEGRKRIECDKIWLLGEGETDPPPEAADVLDVLPRGAGRAEAAGQILDDWLTRRWLRVPVYGCVPIGGESSRMGTRKHLMQTGGVTWLARTAELLAGATERVVIAGEGRVSEVCPRPEPLYGQGTRSGSEDLSDAVHLSDVPDAAGPMAGLLAAMRWAPHVSWLVAACDLPNLSAEALEWLLSTRSPGVWATLPRLPADKGVEPLLAHYDLRARGVLEDLAAQGRFSPSLLAEHPKVATPTPPAHLLSAWTNANSPADLGV